MSRTRLHAWSFMGVFVPLWRGASLSCRQSRQLTRKETLAHVSGPRPPVSCQLLTSSAAYLDSDKLLQLTRKRLCF